MSTTLTQTETAAAARKCSGPRIESSNSVLKYVGITTETCTLAARSSEASVSLNDSTAALVALYEPMPGAEANAAALATLMSRPLPLRCKCGTAARQP